MLAPNGAFTPTPAVSHAIVQHNRSFMQGADAVQHSARADGIIVTPSHNPPRDGGIKYNPPHGGPAEEPITRQIESAANAYLAAGLKGVRRLPCARALAASTTHHFDYRTQYIDGLVEVIDLQAIRDAKLHMGVDPMGGAGVGYWPVIAERWGLDLTVVNELVDPTFGFMTLDWDGQIRMDPASPYAMRRLIGMKDRFDIAFACDTDHDRHGIVTSRDGLLPPNHSLSAAVDYLFQHRPQWGAHTGVGTTVVTTQLVKRVAARLQRKVFETPVGFKWFAAGLLAGDLGLAGEESAGASLLRRDGMAWTTDKDGIAAALLAAETTAVMQRDPGVLYGELTAALGAPVAKTALALATPDRKQRLAAARVTQIRARSLAGEKVDAVLTHAPGNGAPIGGFKLSAASGWVAARPSGTENLIKLYAESFLGQAHLQALLADAQAVVDDLTGSAQAPT